MWEFTLGIFIISICLFAGVMKYEPRTLWSGGLLFFMMLCMALFLLITMYQYSEWLASHDIVIAILIILFILAVFCVMAFPGILILLFFIEGIKVIRYEGVKPANFLSMLFSIALCIYLFVWPVIGGLKKGAVGTASYMIISFCAVYVLSLMAIYVFSAILNLIHLKKSRAADYIIVLGSGILGKKVTPLLAARIEKGIELLHYNPKAMLIMSGGQGDGEEISESEAMAAYAMKKGVNEEKIILEHESISTEENLLFSKKFIDKEDSEILIVTTAYHVFRALILARQLGISCVGFGSKTKWYFTLNALIREFVGYLSLTWKKHICIMGVVACIMAIVWIWV